MNDIDKAFNRIDTLSKSEIANVMLLCDVAIKTNQEKIRNCNVSVLKLKFANKIDELKHKKRVFMLKFHQK